MNNDYELLWKRILGEIETEVSKGSFFTLFKTTRLLSIENSMVTIAAPSTMIIDLIQKKFYQVIKKVVDKYTGFDTKIIFVPKTIDIGTKNNNIKTPLFEDVVDKPVQVGHLPRVRADYTFQTLAVSSSNQLAYVAATAVAKKPGQSYNPLFIYGPVGVGKTHLSQAIANEIYKKTPSKKIIYITSEEFTNEVVEAIRNGDTSRMKNKFRNVNFLAIDDVQFFAGKERVQEELFHTFNILIDRGAQIILSSDRPPSEIRKIEKRLSSRFAGGLIVDIEPPDFELRAAIILIKAKKYNIDLPIEVAKKIAEKSQDARQLEGYLLRIITEAKTKNSQITDNLIYSSLNNYQDEKKIFHPDEIIKTVCNFYNIKPTQIKGPKRNASLVRARQITMFLLKKELNLSLAEIGNVLGGRDHTTVMHGLGKIEKLTSIESFSTELKNLTTHLKNY
ncbi:MAG: hypothetical protein ACD_50C00143G0005 [uncultured bacterium]|nr:MAG: hypothetical protein ACD_50C00143G0005 [uncultured bacterium]OGH14619.1 MAG: chromosomal replication initiator protein DnaA [Candidatus Levybacteria bacterium RIFCSPHIGHO2_01_FULL_38_26]